MHRFKEAIEKFLKDGDAQKKFFTALVIGAMLIFANEMLKKSAVVKTGLDVPLTDIDKKGKSKSDESPEKPALQTSSQTSSQANSQTYEALLEERLKSVFETVEGCGAVKVMVTLTNGREIVVAEDGARRELVTKEVDKSGVSREQQDLEDKRTKIILNGGSEPLVLKSLEPVVEGVIIVCEGGDDVYIKDALVRATETVLGVEAHKVQVLKMKIRK